MSCSNERYLRSIRHLFSGTAPSAISDCLLQKSLYLHGMLARTCKIASVLLVTFTALQPLADGNMPSNRGVLIVSLSHFPSFRLSYMSSSQLGLA